MRVPQNSHQAPQELGRTFGVRSGYKRGLAFSMT